MLTTTDPFHGNSSDYLNLRKDLTVKLQATEAKPRSLSMATIKGTVRTLTGKVKVFFGIEDFDAKLHQALMNNFPDWEARMNYQDRQEKLYRTVLKKSQAMKSVDPFGTHKRSEYYTEEELDAIDYFNGTGVYRKYQDRKTKPNIFDTRQSFLLKMHNPVMRYEFLQRFEQ